MVVLIKACRFRGGCPVIRVRLRELIAEKHYREGQLTTITEIARVIGVHRTTLTKMASNPENNTSTETLDRLCGYFNCRVDQLLEYVPDPPQTMLSRSGVGMADH
jgi:putative transcriptional regulator